jgi:hypothetical protein
VLSDAFELVTLEEAGAHVVFLQRRDVRLPCQPPLYPEIEGPLDDSEIAQHSVQESATRLDALLLGTL